MSIDLTQRLHEATLKANAGRASNPAARGLTVNPLDNSPGEGVQMAAAGITVNPAKPTQTPASVSASPAAAGITVNPFGNTADLNPTQRSGAAFAYSQGVDRATGTGPGSGALAASKGIDMNIAAKRFGTYQKDPNALAMANAREDLLGSGISLSHGPAGGLTITSNGIGQGALPSAGGSSINMNEGNTVMARANAIRQGMIDSQAAPRSTGGSMASYIAAHGLSKDRQEMLDRALTPYKGSQNGQLTIGQLQAARGIYADSQGEALKGAEIDQRGAEAEQRSMLDHIRLGLDTRRADSDAAYGRVRTQSQQMQNDRDMDVQNAMARAVQSGDPRHLAQARFMAAAAGIKLPEPERLQHVQTDSGMMVFDPASGRMAPAVGPDGQPVGSGKPLTEFQGKSTSFGMRADAASRLIDSVGQAGKVQPNLLKRAAEAVPLVGDALGMAANRFASPEQQQVEQAQRDFINSILRQESGAAISEGEFSNARRQYFPQPGDSAEVVAQKRANRELAIDGFRVSAGSGSKHIGGASAPAGQAAQQARGSGSLSAGHVDGGHVFLGGNPNDPASWAEVRK